MWIYYLHADSTNDHHSIDPDAALRHTLTVFQEVCQWLSPIAFNEGKPLRATVLQRRCYHDIKGRLNAQMTISAMRRVTGAYASAKRNKRPAQKPFAFRRKAATFLIGQRARDADFRADGTLSIWTVGGRKRLAYHVPDAFQAKLSEATEIDSLTVIEQNGRLLGRVALTLKVDEPSGIHPVGIDLNETNALVANDADDRTLFISGRDVKIRNKRSFQTRKRVQRKLATRKAQRQDTCSVRRFLKRLGRKRSNRTRTFAQTAAKQLVSWVAPHSILVFEDLHIPQPVTGEVRMKALRRRLSLWQHGLIRDYAQCRAEESGMATDKVNPFRTS
jgi:putative transposase